jgi:hypothetical protein
MKSRQPRPSQPKRPGGGCERRQHHWYGPDGQPCGSTRCQRHTGRQCGGSAGGTFTVILNPAQANGELLDVVAIDGTGASSLPVQVAAPDITPPVTPSELAISANGSVVTGRAEVGSTVRVLAADGTTVLGSGWSTPPAVSASPSTRHR